MKHSILSLLILIAAAPLAVGQFTPPAPSSAAVTVDNSGVLIAPTNFFQQNLGLSYHPSGGGRLDFGDLSIHSEGISFGPDLYFTGLSMEGSIFSYDGTITLNWGARQLLGAWNADALTIANSPVPRPRYPVFVLDVPYGAPWTDFEIKASRTNYGESGSPALIYYYHSPGATGNEIGTPAKVWYTATGADPRRWRALQESPRTSISASLTDANSQVGSIIVVITDPAVADSAADTDLVWAIVWLDGTSQEEDLAGRAIWRAVLPTRWVPAIPQP